MDYNLFSEMLTSERFNELTYSLLEEKAKEIRAFLLEKLDERPYEFGKLFYEELLHHSPRLHIVHDYLLFNCLKNDRCARIYGAMFEGIDQKKSLEGKLYLGLASKVQAAQ